ncbi:MAG: hypothetical protein QM576_06130 [Rhodopseudomonas sp.]|uniref:hypothetical protein n=1 Tax=Rhodopseudomonas sp. TaxID=1078 RepID=UPI0039E35EEC
MKIRDDHFNHGAALIQIAEHPQFTAINSLRIKSSKYDNAYKVNDDLSIYLKYCSRPNNRGEYQFTFHKDQLSDLDKISKANNELFLILVCVEGKEICCLPLEKLHELIERRKASNGKAEDQYVVLLTIPPGGSLHVYINEPGTKGKKLGKDVVIPRNAFPNALFK